MTDKSMRIRIIIIAWFFILFGASLFFRFIYLQVYTGGRMENLSDRQSADVQEIIAERGFIYDSNGRELAVSVEVPSVYAITYQVKDREGTASKLAGILGMRRAEILKKLNSGRNFVWIMRKAEYEKGKRIKGMKLPGINTVLETKRFYPKGALCAHALGFVNEDAAGCEGLELSYNKYLAGKNGKLISVKDAKGREVVSGEVDYEAPQNGNNMVLTINEGVQSIVEEELSVVFEKYHAKEATAIVINPATGEILAMANRPNYDPNSFNNYPMAYLKNRAVSVAYEPGSTFKAVTMAAAFSERVISEGDLINCENGQWEVCGHKLSDHEKYGTLNFRDVIANSSNIGTAKVGVMVGKDRLYKYMRNFGFGDKTGITLSGEVKGTVRSPEKWSGLSLYTVSIGQEISVTPLQIALFYAAIANKGKLMQPMLVKAIKSKDGKIVKEFIPKEVRQVVTEQVAERMARVLKAVIENGTGKEAAIPGISLAGKTGTAQKFDPALRKYSSSKYVASFIGFAPADNPKLAILVVVDEPSTSKGIYYGGSVAAPAFGKIAKRALRCLERKENDDIVKSN
ncbi:MAG: penicillin-binding protein 2 [Candidatus Firestonebacteria bacterium]